MAELCKVNRGAVPRRSITVFTNWSMMPSRVLCTYLYMIGKQRLKSKLPRFKFLRIFPGKFQRLHCAEHVATRSIRFPVHDDGVILAGGHSMDGSGQSR